MKTHPWTIGLAAAGLVTLPNTVRPDEPHSVATALASTTISGYVSGSMHWNPGTGNENNPRYAFGDSAGAGLRKADGFNLDVVKLTVERPLDEGQWAAGYKVDLLLGPDAQSLATTIDSGGDYSAAGLKQAYVTLRAPVGNGLDFKLGLFDTVIGYEVFDAGSNPNYTRSYGYTFEPTEHTGLLMSYQFCEFFSASVGIANTTAAEINRRAFDRRGGNYKSEAYKTYMAAFAATAPESWGWAAGSALYGGVVNGFSPGAPAPNGRAGANSSSLYAGLTVNTPVQGFKVGGAFDYYVVGRSGHATVLGLYASIQASEKLSFHGRGEYVTQNRNWATFGLPSRILAYTATMQYDLWQNVLSRLEFRWDHSGRETTYGGTPSNTTPNRRNAWLLAANVIYKF